MTIYYSNELFHHGVNGQKWGVRKYQNEDGSLTQEGREHYGYGSLNTKQKYRIAKADLKRRYANSDKNNNSYKTAEKELKETYKSDKQISKDIWKEQRNEYVHSLTTGNRVAKFILLGPFGAYSYNSMRATGASRGEAAGITIVNNLLTGGTGISNIAIASIVSYDVRSKY